MRCAVLLVFRERRCCPDVLAVAPALEALLLPGPALLPALLEGAGLAVVVVVVLVAAPPADVDAGPVAA